MPVVYPPLYSFEGQPHRTGLIGHDDGNGAASQRTGFRFTRRYRSSPQTACMITAGRSVRSFA